MYVWVWVCVGSYVIESVMFLLISIWNNILRGTYNNYTKDNKINNLNIII